MSQDAQGMDALAIRDSSQASVIEENTYRPNAITKCVVCCVSFFNILYLSVFGAINALPILSQSRKSQLGAEYPWNLIAGAISVILIAFYCKVVLEQFRFPSCLALRPIRNVFTRKRAAEPSVMPCPAQPMTRPRKLHTWVSIWTRSIEPGGSNYHVFELFGREVPEICLVTYQLFEFSALGSNFPYIMCLAVLLTLNCWFSPVFLFSKNPMLSFYVFAIFDLTLDTIYGSIMPVLSALPPLFVVFTKGFSGMEYSSLGLAIIVGKQLAVGSFITLISKTFPMASNILILGNIKCVELGVQTSAKMVDTFSTFSLVFKTINS